MSHTHTVETPDKPIKVAVIHDWIFQRRGGERVLERILNLYPSADLFYLFGQPEKVLKLNSQHNFYPSCLNRLPFIETIYKWLLPLFPTVIEYFDLSTYDLVISISACAAKGIIPPPLGIHVSYVNSPMRYVWDQEHRYFPQHLTGPFEFLRRFLLNRLRIWDVTSSVRSDVLIANSHFVARRCKLYYGRDASVVYPPIDIHFYQHAPKSKTSKKVLLFGAWVPYKMMYQALSLLIKHHIPVIAAGSGSDIEKAMKVFKGKAEFYIHPTDDEVKDLYQKAHTLLFPAIEDFGIIPLEAMAAGLWVVAPNQGGTQETVIHGVCGYTFREGDQTSMIEAVKKALERDLTEKDYEAIMDHVQTFSSENFDRNFLEKINRVSAK